MSDGEQRQAFEKKTFSFGSINYLVLNVNIENSLHISAIETNECRETETMKHSRNEYDCEVNCIFSSAKRKTNEFRLKREIQNTGMCESTQKIKASKKQNHFNCTRLHLFWMCSAWHQLAVSFCIRMRFCPRFVDEAMELFSFEKSQNVALFFRMLVASRVLVAFVSANAHSFTHFHI